MSFYKNHYDMKSLLEAGVHYGHIKRRWNPKMAPYIYGVRNGTHIIDLEKTVQHLEKALGALKDCAAKNGRILFVSTKKQAKDIISESAKRCGQYYVNNRWLGGTLTNWKTVSASIRKLARTEEAINDAGINMIKSEKLKLTREYDKLDANLGGIRSMGGIPDMMFVLGVNEHKIAIREAKAMKVKVCAIADTNVDPEGVDYIIPGNDDAMRSIELFCNLASIAILEGLEQNLSNSGVDIGGTEEKKAEGTSLSE